jgi:hypothetical protein
MSSLLRGPLGAADDRVYSCPVGVVSPSPVEQIRLPAVARHGHLVRLRRRPL